MNDTNKEQELRFKNSMQLIQLDVVFSWKVHTEMDGSPVDSMGCYQEKWILATEAGPLLANLSITDWEKIKSTKSLLEASYRDPRFNFETNKLLLNHSF